MKHRSSDEAGVEPPKTGANQPHRSSVSRQPAPRRRSSRTVVRIIADDRRTGEFRVGAVPCTSGPEIVSLLEWQSPRERAS